MVWQKLMMAVVVGLLGVCASLEAAVTPTDRAVVVMHCRKVGTQVMARSISGGVLVDSTTVVTSGASFRTNQSLLGVTIGEGEEELFVIVRQGGEQLIVPAKREGEKVGPVVVLRIAEAGAIDVARTIGERAAVAELTGKVEAVAVGTVAPAGITPDSAGVAAIPPAAAMPVKLGEVNGKGPGRAPLDYPLPAEFNGAGVWNRQGQLMGVVAVNKGRWGVLSVADVLVKNGPRQVEAEKPTETAQQPPAVAVPKDPVATGVQVPPSGRDPIELAGLMKLIKEKGLKLRIHEGLLDYVKQDQADMVMAYIAGGQFAQAIAFLDDVQPLASGRRLGDQLNYRRALALVLWGRASEAVSFTVKAQASEDPLVRARAKILNRVLEVNADGKFGGDPLSDSQVLAAAIQAELTKIEKVTLAAFEAVRGQPLVSKSSYEAALQKLEQIRRTVDGLDGAWPGYLLSLKQQMDLFAQQLVRNEYARVLGELAQVRRDYEAEVAQTEFKEASQSWSRAGYWPQNRVGTANLLSDRFDDLLKHVKQLEGQLTPMERKELTEDVTGALPKLPLARQADRR